MESVKSWIKSLISPDHRKAERLASPLLVAYYWDGSVPTAHKIRSISETGFYLLTRERWHPGTVVTMTLQKTDGARNDSNSEHYISVLSKVVRHGKDGVGFAFVPVEARAADSDKTSRSSPVGKKALARFLENVKLDQDCPMIGPGRGVATEMLLGQDASLKVPGENTMTRLRDESGQSLIIAALCMTCLMGFVALAADVGVMLREKRLVQTAADSAAIAGAAELNYGNTSAAAQAAAVQNGFANGSNGATVVVNPTALNGPHAGVTGYVEVIVSQSQPTLFMALFGRTAMTVAARAVAANGTTNGCVYTLGNTGPDLSMTGNANIQITTCGIVIDSSSNNALSANGNVTLDAQSIGVVGQVSKNGNVTINPTPVTGIVPTSDPLGFLPAPAIPKTCFPDPKFSGNLPNGTLSPGCYNGLTYNGNINLTLSPGLYVINGNVNLTGNVSLSGTNVTLDLLGSFSIPGNVALNLTAPTSGTYNGVVIFQPLSNTDALSLTGNSGSTFQGIVYAPGAAVSLTGNSGSTIDADFVAKTLSLVGNASFNDYAAVNPNSVLTAVKLVE